MPDEQYTVEDLQNEIALRRKGAPADTSEDFDKLVFLMEEVVRLRAELKDGHSASRP